MIDFKQDINLLVDLDEERNIVVKPDRTPNQHRVTIRKTNTVNLAAIAGYLEGRTAFNNTVLEAISEISTDAPVNVY